MSLFQKSVEKKYLNELDSALIDKKFAEFKEYFGNPERQENIRNSKEEQFQEGFLRELFVKILDYTLNPEPNFNLTTELKNVSDSKKADGAILRNENAVAVIELKSTDTTDLGKVESQAFGYKNHHPKCVYVITSNFEKLRFYIQNAVNHLEFDLFKLTREEFSLLWLCVAKDNLLSDLPLKIKESSLAQEENITKQLYSDYSKFREALYLNLVKNNPEIDKLTLFKKTQKLIDRFLFIFFAEDKQLLPANSIIQIIEKWKDDVDFGDTKPLYSLFKQYFHILNVGRPKSEKRQEIFAYNGGLFLTDEILENINIDDEVLKEHTLKLSNYDFDTDVDVNILGHIFEHSLGEIENVQAEIKGEKIDVQKTKRKKDGIFYTPKYITKYIVENTVGKLCEEKRNELEIVDEEYAKGRKNRRKETIKELDGKLKKYQEWLLSLTILDPACGSGAFLNQALEFLIEEHKKIDELRAQLLGGSLVFSDITTDILEKNIYGVDINEESVEIAKLSLWLRTARKGRKLNTLSNNIKCGNSLIDDPEIAGDKAFNWQKEFPEIFAKGGFDVIIGNPPYITFALGAKQKHSDSITEYLKNKYPLSSSYKVSSYLIFIEVGLSLLNSKGKLSYIIPNTYHTNYFYKEFREKLIDSYQIEEILDIRYKVFEDAEMGYTSIPTFAKTKNNHPTKLARICKAIEFNNIQFFNMQASEFKKFPDSKFLFQKELMKLWFNSQQDSEILSNSNYFTFYNGTKTGNNDKFLLDSKENDLCKPVIRGKDFYRYQLYDFEKYILFDKEALWSNTNDAHFTVNEKLLIRRTSDHLAVAYDNSKYYVLDTVHLLYSNTSDYLCSYLLALLNSKLFHYLYNLIVPEGGKAFAEVKIVNLKKFPIKKCDFTIQNELGLKALRLQELNKNLLEHAKKIIALLNSRYSCLITNTKLIFWYDLEFNTFIQELKKEKIILKLNEEVEWLQYFNEQKIEAQNIKSEIDSTDKEIDKMVFELYGLSDDEIKNLEESI